MRGVGYQDPGIPDRSTQRARSRRGALRHRGTPTGYSRRVSEVRHRNGGRRSRTPRTLVGMGQVVSFWRLAECERRLDLKLLRSRRSPEWRYQRSSNRSSRPRLRTQRTPSSLGSSANNRSTRASNCWRVGSSRHSALAAELRPRDPGAFARSFSRENPAAKPDESLPSIRMSADKHPGLHTM